MRRSPLLLLALLPGCATLTEGPRQLISINTNPPGAACVVDRNGDPAGEHLDEIAHTPGTVLVDRSNRALRVTCALQGFPTTQALQGAGLNPVSGANVINGAVIGTAIDISSGAFYRYPDRVLLTLAPVAAAPPPPKPVRTMTGVVAAPRALVKPAPLAPPAKPTPLAPAPVGGTPPNGSTVGH